MFLCRSPRDVLYILGRFTKIKRLGKDMRIISNAISMADLTVMAKARFGDLVKAVVDVERELMAVDGELHSDEEALLLENGSLQRNLWGINIYPEIEKDWIEFDSIINIRPSQNNRSRGVDDAAIREKIINVVLKLVRKQ